MLTLDEAIHNYLSQLEIGHSRETVEGYGDSLRMFQRFLAERSISDARDVAEITVDELMQFIQWESKRPGRTEERVKKSTLMHYMTPVKEFYIYLVINRKVNATASDMVRLRETFRKFRKGYTRPLPIVSQAAINDLIREAGRREIYKSAGEQLRQDLERLRNVAMLHALRSSGMRVGELVKLKRGDFNYREHTAIVTGKGNKQRVVYFDNKTWQALEMYWYARGDRGQRGGARGVWKLPCFSRHDRCALCGVLPMTTNAVGAIINRLEQRGKLEKHLYPHAFRHAFATKVLEVTGDLAAVQDFLGHESPDTTRIYARVSQNKIRAAHRLAFAPPERKIESEILDWEMRQVIGLDVETDPATAVIVEPVKTVVIAEPKTKRKRVNKAEAQVSEQAGPFVPRECACFHPDFDHAKGTGACGLCTCRQFTIKVK